jgi:hypothetical protein
LREKEETEKKTTNTILLGQKRIHVQCIAIAICKLAQTTDRDRSQKEKTKSDFVLFSNFSDECIVAEGVFRLVEETKRER